MTVIKKTSTRTERSLKNLIEQIPDILSGKRKDRLGIRKVFIAAFTWHLMDKIHHNFILKALRGPDELGNQWHDLKPATKARIPLTKGEAGRLRVLANATRTSKAKVKFAARGERGLLTAAQNKEWKRIFSSTLYALTPILGEAEATKKAAGHAWKILKIKGAKTKIDLYSNRNLTINIRSGKLEKALRPGRLGATSRYKPRNQKQHETSEKVTITIDVPYSGYVHNLRALWPEDISQWINESAQEALKPLLRHLQRVI